MKASVDQDTCVGSGMCTQTCPEVFEMEGGKAKVKVDTVPEGAEDSCRQAADECPTQAISVQE